MGEIVVQKPLIVAIGASWPTIGYKPAVAMRVGYELRGMIESFGGSLFTGGVEGVGVDFYRGVINYCKEKELKEDRFFVVYPEIGMRPPMRYDNYAAEIGGNLAIVKGGKDMMERRQRLAETADFGVVLNGSHGTLDEAVQIIKAGKTLFALNSTGGVARLLRRYNMGQFLRNFDNIDDMLVELEKFIHKF